MKQTTEQHPLLCSIFLIKKYTVAARERLGEHFPAATNMHATEERCFLRGPFRDISKGQD
jgi:hypothetical protein